MTTQDVLDIYNLLDEHGVSVWVDGGWCVDALLGKQTRDHPDLDIAVDRADADRLKEVLSSRGFSSMPRDDTSDWNYALTDVLGRQVDVHVFEYDGKGNIIYGIEYPMGSLTGTGTIGRQQVNCIAPEWMFKFKTAYTPKPKDLQDVNALAEKFGYPVPESHRLPNK